jgi:hypothetical protein
MDNTSRPAELDASIAAFIKTNLEVTGDEKNFAPLEDIYNRYVKQTKNKISRTILFEKIKNICPVLSFNKKKINKHQVFWILSGCKLLNERETDRGYVIALDLLNDPNLQIETIKEFSDGSIEILLNSKKPRKFVTEAIYG